ncbi:MULTISPECIES: FprA family A-type flavoprotein [Syntrophotalea]|jgi:flavorubredoxin|uniref:MBL fold metallo-hydrolase n=1 Tax=Syntrophotalea acetylenica TaxID=29542 RepID=A0A1L3GGA3_SYNAC|nr:FprA family A-type flavoprotein [Syntrophotalea acetylenica]APG24991.1 MBL fold metallo-hydrolase [Syntrophotalea acetylenica]APG43058.1 MBL fold metallo-hydrolase [Syntrophotalea acetylenica]MDY0261026.1 FprA family A-type flavoprotein [Syntrophotalea acetylenica]
MIPRKLAEGVYEVGATDWNIRDFHGYSTDLGSTYNAYLVVDEKIALIDTVKKEFTDQLLQKISQIVDPSKIDLVISNHTEMDHSGGLPELMEVIGRDKPVYCSSMGLKNLRRHFPDWLNLQQVSDGQELSLGNRTLQFLETRMIHWPDSMFSYLKEEQILFSSDGFGQHYAGPERFDDEIGDAIMAHAKKYFANILWPFAALIQKLLDKLIGTGLPIRMICPDHGIIWRRDPGKIVGAYLEWCRQQPGREALVIYDTMWHSTETMAGQIVAGLQEAGVKAQPMHARSVHRSDIVTAAFDAGALIVGSPTLNNGIFPTLADVLTYLKGLKPCNKLGAAFGSYGWSGEAPKMVHEMLAGMGLQMIEEPLRVQFVPERESLASCREFGRRIGQALQKS